ncbi:hypothetical protein GOBAR_AA15162 [Gossypium barbadense]|uniref:Transposase MuDR plant domain-containing protein n=1 Tax=Gossypium barbadense TaxID=3634 RepID=A0A2P5XQ80_GOSBA|nr:hypothetical protein GOBAR_AA15162 [Gossypium barbadense]
MEHVDDEDVETMITLYCWTLINQNAPIQLFAELAGVEPTEDPTPLDEEHGAQESCMVVPISYVDSQSTIRGIDIDLSVVPETDVVGDNVYHSSDPSDHEVNSDIDLDVDELPDDIDDESMNDDEKFNASSVGNQICRIVIYNNLRAYMSRTDPDAAHAVEFSEYLKILPAYRLAVDSDLEELFVGQRFESKEECIFFIKRVLEVGGRLQLTDTNCIYPEVVDMGDTKIRWALHMHINTNAMVANWWMTRLMNVERSSVVDPVYHLDPMELISEMDDEMPLKTFEFVPDKGLRRNLKDRLQSSRIHNEIDIREKFDGNLCGVCRLAGHNRSKYPLQNYHIGQSSRSGRN